MVTFGKRLREARETRDLSQQDLAKLIGSFHTVIGRYERKEMKPSIGVVKRLADELGTTIGYLIGEAKEARLLKDPAMLKRFQEIDDGRKKKRSVFNHSLTLILLKINYRLF